MNSSSCRLHRFWINPQAGQMWQSGTKLGSGYISTFMVQTPSLSTPHSEEQVRKRRTWDLSAGQADLALTTVSSLYLSKSLTWPGGSKCGGGG